MEVTARQVLRVLLALCGALWVAAAVRLIVDVDRNPTALGLTSLLVFGGICVTLAMSRLERVYQWLPAGIIVVLSVPAAGFLILYEPA